MGQLNPSDVAYLLRDLSNVLMPQPNPEHVLFIQKSLLLRAIFRLIPKLKKKTIYSWKYANYNKKKAKSYATK